MRRFAYRGVKILSTERRTCSQPPSLHFVFTKHRHLLTWVRSGLQWKYWIRKRHPRVKLFNGVTDISARQKVRRSVKLFVCDTDTHKIVWLRCGFWSVANCSLFCMKPLITNTPFSSARSVLRKTSRNKLRSHTSRCRKTWVASENGCLNPDHVFFAGTALVIFRGSWAECVLKHPVDPLPSFQSDSMGNVVAWCTLYSACIFTQRIV